MGIMERRVEVVVYADCPFCNMTTAIKVPEAGFLKWKRGAMIQDALPELNEQERDVLVSGLCSKCWNETYPEDDDE